jgi:hypothetical protein
LDLEASPLNRYLGALMVHHAGFAAALTMREGLLDDALMLAYASGDFPHQLRADLPGGPPPARVDVFVAAPRIRCDESLNSLVLTVRMWGDLSVTIDGGTSQRQIDGQLVVRISPRFNVVGTTLVLSPESGDLTVSQWTFTVLAGGPFPDAVDQYVRSSFFRDRLQAALRLAVQFGVIRVPPIDVSFLGDVASAARSPAAGRVREGVVLVGLDIDSPALTTAGRIDQLVDFAGPNDIAAVTNAEAVPVLLGELAELIRDAVEEQHATLEDPVITVEPGRFRVRAAASRSEGTATFSFAVVPALFHFRPGRFFQYLQTPFVISDRTWPALEFSVADIKVSIDRADWVVWVEVLGGIFTAGVLAIHIERKIGSIIAAMHTEIVAADTGAPTPRVRRRSAAGGRATVRMEVADYELSAAEVYVGVKVTTAVRPPSLVGPRSIPDDISDQGLSYEVQLPIDAATDDPALRIRWSVFDVASGHVLLNDDGIAANRLTFSFVPASAGPGLARLGVGVRVYRPLGATITEVINEGITLELSGPRGAGSYVRWRYGAPSPQVEFNEREDTWVYTGDRVNDRRSKLHRRDQPCANVAKRSRYAETEILDALPFPVAQLPTRRAELCDYCFFGGPAGLNASL